jgi:hypothetical protein
VITVDRVMHRLRPNHAVAEFGVAASVTGKNASTTRDGVNS